MRRKDDDRTPILRSSFAECFTAPGYHSRNVGARLVAYTVLLGWNPNTDPTAVVDDDTDVPTASWFTAAATRYVKDTDTIEVPGQPTPVPHSVGHSTRKTVSDDWIKDNFGGIKEATDKPLVQDLDLYLYRNSRTVARDMVRVVHEVKELTFEPMLHGALWESGNLTVDPYDRTLAALAALAGWAVDYPYLAVLDHAEPPQCLIRWLGRTFTATDAEALVRISRVAIRVGATPGSANLTGVVTVRDTVQALSLGETRLDAKVRALNAALGDLWLTRTSTNQSDHDRELVATLQWAADRFARLADSDQHDAAETDLIERSL